MRIDIFYGYYYHYFYQPEIRGESIAERAKLKRQRLDMVKEKERNINNELFSHYFHYSNPN